MQHDWTKPAAKAIPKGGFFEEEQGRYGPIFPSPDFSPGERHRAALCVIG
jgi:hypothetical protein